MRKLYAGLVVAAAWSLAPQAGSAQEPSLFDRLDANKDGFVTPDEAGDDKKRLFEQLLRNADKNGDGKLSKEEFAQGTKPRTEEPRRDEPARGDRPAGRPNIQQLFERFDKNGDGKLSKEEAWEGLRRNFDQIDANKDGFADKEEIAKAGAQPGGRPDGARPDGARPGGPSAEEIFARFDKNKDGKLTKDEAPDPAPPFFERADANQDGAVEKEELARFFARRDAARPEGAPRDREALAQLFKQQDKNGDGKLTTDEVPEDKRESFKEMLRRLDKGPDDGINLEQFVRFVGGNRGEPARQPEPGARPAGGRIDGFPGGGLLRALDTNGDGQLSAEEIAGASKALAALDKNGDGKLSRDELQPPPPPGGTPRGEFNPQAMLERLKAGDKNGDGKLSKEEVAEFPFFASQFGVIDGNEDGFIDTDELRKFLTRQADRPARPRPEGERRPDRPEGERRPDGERPEPKKP